MNSNTKVVLLAGSRTPIGSFGRSLKRTRVDKLAEHSLRNAMRRAGIDPGQVDGVILGHAFQSGFTPNLARYTWNNAGFSNTVPAWTVQMQCGSGMKAVAEAMDRIALGRGSLYLAGGAESMSTVPYILSGDVRYTSKLLRWLPKFAPLPLIFAVADDGLAPRRMVWDPKTVYMSFTAQRVAEQFGISREAMDEYALRSQLLAAEAIKSGRFDLEIDAIQTGNSFFLKDEHPRETSLEKLKSLRSAFDAKPKRGVGGLIEKALKGILGINDQPTTMRARDITAGNSSGINDGACSLVLASEDFATTNGIEPLAVLVDYAEAGVDPETMGLGPVAAIRALLDRTGLSLSEIDRFEINEAFAAQYLGCEKLLGLDRNKVNVNGGAIALGHPIAMSGARVILTLAHELKLRGLKRGIASLCIGGGMGIAMLIENPSAR